MLIYYLEGMSSGEFLLWHNPHHEDLNTINFMKRFLKITRQGMYIGKLPSHGVSHGVQVYELVRKSMA